MNFVAYDIEYGNAEDKPSLDAHLRFELGWSEVRRGLAGILRGNLVIIAAVLLVVAALFVFLDMSVEQRRKVPWQVRDIAVFLGGAVFSLICIYGYGCIVIGHWRCLMNAPERCGAKWLMFACLTCILAGPALNFAAGLSGVQRQPRFDHGWNGLREFRYDTAGLVMQLGSAAVQMLGSVFFMLFLRAVCQCFEDAKRSFLVHGYLIYMVGVSVVSICLVVMVRDVDSLVRFLPLLGLAWLGSVVGYLVVVASCRRGIAVGLSKVGSPFDPQARGNRPLAGTTSRLH